MNSRMAPEERTDAPSSPGKKLPWSAGRATPSPQAPSTTGWGWEATHGQGPPCPPVGRAAAPVGSRSGRGGGGPATDAARKVKEPPPHREGGGAAAATGRGARPGEGYAKWGGATPTVPIRRMRGGSSGADVLGGLREDAARCGGEIPMCSGVGRCGRGVGVGLLRPDKST